jgi:hypothetical protein
MRLGWLVPVVAILVITIAVPTLVHEVLLLRLTPWAFAASGGPNRTGHVYQGDNDNDGDNDDGRDDNGNGIDDNDNGGNDNDNGGNDNDFDLDDIYDDLGIPRPSSSSSRSRARDLEPTCSQPGQDTVFTSYDGKVAIHVFASSPRPLRVVIYRVINVQTAPQPPGDLVGTLVYEIWASSCDENALTDFPAEVNLGIRHTDREAAGLDESRFIIGRLDLTTGAWAPIEKRANDPPANHTSATIIKTGYYAVWQAR